MGVAKQFNVVILGAGLAGLTLCRQLLLSGKRKRILFLDNRVELPGRKQKVGESLVQVAGYYLARILDLEEHLLSDHYPKYNLRYHWKTSGRENRNLEDYGQSYIGKLSNIGTYQLNRNKIEDFLLECNLNHPDVTLCAPATALHVDLSDGGLHDISFRCNGEEVHTQAEWVVDTTGRGQLLKRKNDLQVASAIHNGASWCWVEGLVNIEKLTDLPSKEVRTRRDLKREGVFPTWLATNHFCGEGFWFWVIPLKGLTSLGVVYDNALFAAERVSTAEKLIQWACKEFPLFARDLPHRRVLDSARLATYAYDCRQTISSSKWAMSGMSGRFSDPLYSPGSDLIAFYNTMIVDAILETDPEKMRGKCELYEPLMKVIYEAYVPSYAVSYDALGDQEVFTLKYSWELAVYFSFYAFPFVNDFFTNAQFIRCFFRKFAQLGPINRNLQQVLSDYYQWKKRRTPNETPILNDFLELPFLKRAETTYYRVGLSVEEAEEALEDHLRNLKKFARFILAYISSRVVGSKQVLLNRSFITGIRSAHYRFNPEEIRQKYAALADLSESYDWEVDPFAMEKFRIDLRWQLGTKDRTSERVAR